MIFQVYSNVQEDVTVADVTNLFKSKYPSVDLDEVFDEDSDYDVGRLLAQEFVEKAGISNLPQVSLYIFSCDVIVQRSIVGKSKEDFPYSAFFV